MQNDNKNENPALSEQYERLKKAAEGGDYRAFALEVRSGEITTSTSKNVGFLINALFSSSDEEFEQKHSDLYISWCNAFAGNAEPVRSNRLQEILLSAASKGSSYSPFGVARLMGNGVNPCAPIDQKAYSLAGMRNDMYVFGRTPISIAIDNGRLEAVEIMFSSEVGTDTLHKQSVALVSIAPIEVPVEKVEWAAMDALGFAIATGQTEIFRSLLSASNQNDSETRRQAGQTINDILRIGLLDSGPDTVLGDIVTLMGWGAEMTSDTKKRLLNQRMAIGYVKGLESFADAQASFAAMITLSTSHAARATSNHATQAIAVLLDAGLDVNDDICDSRAGAKLIHFAAAGGDTSLITTLLKNHANGQDMDSIGKRPVDYANDAQQKSAGILLSGASAMESIKSHQAKTTNAQSKRVNSMFEKLKAQQQGNRPSP